MINVLSEALPHVDALIMRKPITIIKREIVNNKGFASSTETSLNTLAHAQPLTSFEIVKLTDSTLDSKSVYKFYFIGNLAEVLNFLNCKDCEIIFEGRRFSVYSKDDWAKNGWLKVIAYERATLPKPEPAPKPDETEGENGAI